MDFWSIFKSLLGGFDFESPRDMLLKSIGTSVVDPAMPNLLTQQYFDIFSLVVAVCIPLLVLELVVRGYYGLNESRIGEEMMSFGKTMVFATVLILLIPGSVLTAKKLFDAQGVFMLQSMLGTSDINQIIKALSELTGNGALDFFLNPVQTAFLFVLFLELNVITAMVFAAALVLTVGVFTRWMGNFGVTMFKFSVTFSLFGVALNLILLLIFGVDFALQRMLFANSQVGKGAMNTLAIIVAVFVIPAALKALKPEVLAVGRSAAQGMKSLRSSAKGNNGPVYDENGSSGRSGATQRSFERRQSRRADQNDDSSETGAEERRGWRKRGRKADSDSQEPSTRGSRRADQETGEHSTPRTSSTAARSRPGRRGHRTSSEGTQNSGSTGGNQSSPVVEHRPRERRDTPQELNTSHRRSTATSQGAASTERRGSDSSAGGRQPPAPTRTRS